MKHSTKVISILFLVLISLQGVFAQTTESENARSALKAGSSKELFSMLDSKFELVLFEKKYNRIDSESILKDFFITNPAKDFKYVHKGASRDGTLSYSIGHYETGKSKYRIVIRYVKSSGDYKIHKLEVSTL